MKVCRVLGSVVATVAHPAYAGRALLWVHPEDATGACVGPGLLAIDTVSAGPGDRVLVLSEGRGARQILRDERAPGALGDRGHCRCREPLSMLPRRRQLENDLVCLSGAIHERGWVANHDGNLSVQLAPQRFLVTPTALSKGAVQAQHLLVVDDHGKRVSGLCKPFSELDMHLLVMRKRPDVGAVIHAHPPHATALAVTGQAVLSTMLAEAVVSLGAKIPLVPFAAPKSPDVTLNLLPVVQEVDAVTLENHGVLVWGPDLETAYLRLELVEHLARIQCLARQVGTVRTLDARMLEPLLRARTQAGLGPAGRKAL